MLSTLSNDPRDYAWGSTRLIAALQGRAEAAGPEAELWFGDHPGGSARLSDGRKLSEVTGGTLPFLLKLLAAAGPLSIQVHPTLAQAQSGFEREAALPASERLYSDRNHKPEMVVALTAFEALAGMREAQEALTITAVLGDAAAPLQERLRREHEPLRAAVQWALAEADAAQISPLIAAIVLSDSAELAPARLVAEHYPDDAGVIVALLMNHVRLEPGEAMFTHAGQVHAYLSGLGVEVMAASDNVLRGGLTHKRVDVPEFLAIAELTPAPVRIQRPDLAAEVIEFDVPTPDFVLRRVRCAGDLRVIAELGAAIALAVTGEVTASSGDDTVTLRPGQAAFLSSGSPPLTLGGDGEVYIASQR